MDDVLGLFQEHPLLLRAEVEERGTDYLEQMEKLVRGGDVGCKNIEPCGGVVYWMKTAHLKEEDELNKSSASPSTDTPPLKGNNPAKFVSPLLKRPRLTPELHRLAEEKKLLENKVKEKEDEIRKLKMIQIYRSKNDLQELDTLIEKWRLVSQEAAETLLVTSNREPRPTMTQLLDYLHIDHTLIHYSPQDEAFY